MIPPITRLLFRISALAVCAAGVCWLNFRRRKP